MAGLGTIYSSATGLYSVNLGVNPEDQGEVSTKVSRGQGLGLVSTLTWWTQKSMSLIRIQEQVLSLQADIQSDLYAFSASRGPSDKDRVLVLVDGVPLQMLPDTGASVTITIILRQAVSGRCLSLI